MKIIKSVVLSLMFVAASLGLAFLAYERAIDRPLPIETAFNFDVNKGASMNGVLHELHELGVIDSIVLAKIHVRYQRIAGKLKAGEFEISPGLSLRTLLTTLTSNSQIRYRITFIEGSTFREARMALAAHPKVQHTLTGKSDKDVLDTLQKTPADADLKTKVAKAFPHPEGSIYPDTYFFHKNETDLSVLSRAHDRLVKVLAEEWNTKQQNLPLKTPYEALILASIVEKETGKPSERSEISGVFVRRLNKKMRLQTDPTVIYGLGDRYKGNIKRKHLKELTPYNTYRINGLPPTPIALVGREAIHAALNPKEGKSLYFVAKGDGSHAFSETITEHNKAVRKYQLKRRSDYRSSHQQAVE